MPVDFDRVLPGPTIRVCHLRSIWHRHFLLHLPTLLGMFQWKPCRHLCSCGHYLQGGEYCKDANGGGKGCYLGKIWTSRWWQLTYFSMFHPRSPAEEIIQFDEHIFQLGWNHGPTKKWSIITNPDSCLKETKFLIIIADFFGNHQHCRLVENSRYFVCFGQRFRMFHSIRGDGAWVALSPP